MAETVADTGMTQEQLAASIYRVGCIAAGVEPLAWGAIDPTARQSWIGVAAKAEEILAALDSQPARDAARRLAELYAIAPVEGMWERSPIPFRLAWEAVARHLATLFDADEIDDLPALEQSWGEWAKKRLQPAEAK